MGLRRRPVTSLRDLGNPCHNPELDNYMKASYWYMNNEHANAQTDDGETELTSLNTSINTNNRLNQHQHQHKNHQWKVHYIWHLIVHLHHWCDQVSRVCATLWGSRPFQWPARWEYQNRTRRSKLCSFWKGKWVFGCDDVNENDGLYWAAVGCTGTQMGCTGMYCAVLNCTGLY